MFIGHFAVGLGAKKILPEVSLGTLFIACQLLDLVWPLLVLAGLESVRVDHHATVVTPLDFVSYPFSHSLFAAFAWAALFGWAYYLAKKNLRAAILLGGVVLSHWILDFLTHRADLPLLTNDSPKLGLSLWNSLFGTLFVEVSIFVLGTSLYMKAKGVLPRKTKAVFFSLITFLSLVYLANLFGPKAPVDAPPEMIAGPALAMWLVVAWGYWVERSSNQMKIASASSET